MKETGFLLITLVALFGALLSTVAENGDSRISSPVAISKGDIDRQAFLTLADASGLDWDAQTVGARPNGGPQRGEDCGGIFGRLRCWWGKVVKFITMAVDWLCMQLSRCN
jgi:hypothetical protein